MRPPVRTLHNEEGFVLITGLLILLILTMLGITATRNTSIELQIAGNDRLHKETFYSAESGAILGTEILEQNFNCVTGFKSTDSTSIGDPPEITKIADLEGQIRVFERLEKRGDSTSDMNKLAFYTNYDFVDENFDPDNDAFYVANPYEADVAFPKTNLDPGGNPADDLPGTNYLYIAGRAHMLPGGALQMAAGYERKGKGAAGGGVAKIMDIYSQYIGPRNSESIILLSWRHLTDEAVSLSKYCE